MFTGHTAFALAGKRLRRQVPLALLVAAAYASDILEIAARLLGAQNEERIRMYSHSAVADLVIAVVLGGAYWARRRDDARGALLIVALVFTHWVGDFFTGANKPTWPGGPWLGLDLYSHHAADAIVESVMLLAAAGLLALTPADALRRRRAMIALAIVLVPLQAAFDVAIFRGNIGWTSKKHSLLRERPHLHKLLGF